SLSRNLMTEPVAATATPAVDQPAHRYTAELAGRIEQHWQDRWEAEGTFHSPNPVGDLADGQVRPEKFYLLDMSPYPSGKGLHVGHPLGYIATDVVGRFKRMRSEEHTSELQSRFDLVCRLLLEKENGNAARWRVPARDHTGGAKRGSYCGRQAR